MFGNKLINTNAGGGCTNTVDLYNPFPDGGGVALYQLNGDATDVSGNYDGTASNVTYGAGEFGQAGVFNGSSSVVSIDSVASQISSSNTPFTISVWVKAAAIGSTMAAYEIGDWFTGTVRVIIHTTGIINLSIKPGGAVDWNIEATTPLAAGVWTNITATYNGSYANLYINGVFSGTASGSKVMNTLIANIGNSQGTFFFNGSIDQFRIFNRALRPYEVEALYTEEYCTPTIVPSEHFNTVTYTGNGSANHAITGVGFSPDFTWIKNRDTTTFHALVNSVVGENYIQYSNSTSAGETNANIVTSLDSDGFTVGIETTSNGSGQDLVAWNFKAGGAAVSNTDGTITSQVSANTEAGFSVVSYTGSGANATIGHGLGAAPSMIIVKGRNTTYDWVVYNSNLTATKYQTLNTTIAATSASSVWNDTEPTSTVFSVGSNLATNQSADPKIAYCFAEVEGFSNFGSYVGNLSSQTNIVTGFEPAFVIIKCSSGFNSGRWFMWDNKRSPSNINQKVFFADLATAEEDNIVFGLNFLENGFSIPTTTTSNSVNQTGYTYIYMAFAADSTTIEPSLEDSFNTVLYTGNGGTQSISTVGFQPDFTWIKSRTSTLNHIVFDSVRGAGKVLYPNLTYVADDSGDYWLSSFDSNGFTVNVVGGGGTNQSGVNYVAWNWKGAELPAINSNGSIPSVVSANPAAGFSIVSWTGNGISGSNVGHGLSQKPEMIIVKNRTSGSAQWAVYHSAYGATKHTLLNTTDAASTTGDWNNTEPTSSVITFNDSLRTNANGNNYIAYVFHSVEGFSKFGFWQGGTTSINLGFEPAFVLNQDYGAGGGWGMFDSVRGFDKVLAANSSNAEVSSTFITPNATGFTVPSESSIVFRLYMAFANQF